MMGFKDWFEEEKKYYPLRLDAVSCRKGYEAGAASRQAEVDAALKQRDSFIKAHHISMDDVCRMKAERDALQKRIDEALVEIAEYYREDGMTDLVFSDMAKILKGELE